MSNQNVLLDAFHCNECKEVTNQKWMHFGDIERDIDLIIENSITDYNREMYSNFQKYKFMNFILNNLKDFNDYSIQELSVSICKKCNSKMYWISKDEFNIMEIIYPKKLNLEYKPEYNMEEEAKKLFNEAASIFELSPRSSCVLLRVALETILRNLDKEKFSDKKIYEILKSEEIKTFLDEEDLKLIHSFKNLGNNAAHENSIFSNEEEAKVDAKKMFEFLNLIYKKISSKKSISDFIEKYNKKDNVK